MNIKFTLSNFVKNLFNNKRFVVPFALAVSFIFWLVFMLNQNPVRNREFKNLTVSIPIEKNQYAVADKLSIVSDYSSQLFTVTVSGPNYIVSSLKADDFNLVADVEAINSADVYRLNVKCESEKSGYTYTVSPSTISVKVDYIDTKTFDVEPNLVGFEAENGYVTKTPIIANTENTVFKISGPRTVLSKIAKVEAYAEVNAKLKATETYDAAIVLYDESDKIIYKFDTDGKVYNSSNQEVTLSSTYLTPNFTTAKVFARIAKVKTVPLVASFSNKPESFPDNEFVYDVSPKTVTIIGSPETLDEISSISLSAIDYKKLTKYNKTFTVTMDIPDGVEFEDQPQKIVVTVDYDATQQKIKNLRD